jgi:hypothetical protein
VNDASNICLLFLHFGAAKAYLKTYSIMGMNHFPKRGGDTKDRLFEN